MFVSRFIIATFKEGDVIGRCLAPVEKFNEDRRKARIDIYVVVAWEHNCFKFPADVGARHGKRIPPAEPVPIFTLSQHNRKMDNSNFSAGGCDALFTAVSRINPIIESFIFR